MTDRADRSQPLLRLLEVMARLRGESGCPWDKKQDHRSLVPYLIEEAYEVVDAIERGGLPADAADDPRLVLALFAGQPDDGREAFSQVVARVTLLPASGAIPAELVPQKLLDAQRGILGSRPAEGDLDPIDD